MYELEVIVVLRKYFLYAHVAARKKLHAVNTESNVKMQK